MEFHGDGFLETCLDDGIVFDHVVLVEGYHQIKTLGGGRGHGSDSTTEDSTAYTTAYIPKTGGRVRSNSRGEIHAVVVPNFVRLAILGDDIRRAECLQNFVFCRLAFFQLKRDIAGRQQRSCLFLLFGKCGAAYYATGEERSAKGEAGDGLE